MGPPGPAPTQRGGYGAPQGPSYGGPQPPQQQHGGGESTSAFPGYGGHDEGDDLGSTIALPQTVSNAIRQPAAGQAPAPVNQPSSVSFGFGQQMGGQMGGPPGQPGMGNPQQMGGQMGGPQSGYGMQAPQMHPGMQGMQMQMPQGPQSQIETAISLPRPDPASIWLAQQEAARGQGRSSGVIIAVVALTALCIIGIVSLLYFKFRGGPSGAVPDPAAVTTAAAATMAPPAPTGAAPSSAPSSAPAATASASATASAPAGAASATSAAGSGAAAPAPAKDMGYLTLSCDPRCDQVLIGGRAFVPPIVREPFPAGSIRVKATLGPMTKVISVVIVADQVSPTKISMKK